MPELIGHRGSPRDLRENTLESFTRALDQGCDGVELDVHGTADGHVVVHHDPVTNARPGERGPRIVIRESTLAQLDALDSPRIPTLESVLDLCAGRATVYVEVKGAGIEVLVAELACATRAACAIHSFDHRIVRRCAELAGGVPRGILQTSYLIDSRAALADARARDLWQHWELIDSELVRSVHEAGGRIIGWTVNDPAVARAFVEMGVDGICTDVPAELREIVRAGESPATP